MRCEYCDNIIDNNSVRCPYCKQVVRGDDFGYDRAMRVQQAQAQAARKPDNSVKIAMIILGVIMGVFSVVTTLVVAMDGGIGTASVPVQQEYNGVFNIANGCTIGISDGSSASIYHISIQDVDDAAEPELYSFLLGNGEGADLSLQTGTYRVTVTKGRNDCIILKMIVGADCDYNTVEVQYSLNQLQTTNGVNAHFQKVVPPKLYETVENPYSVKWFA